jgi:thioesterase domain-containing protein
VYLPGILAGARASSVGLIDTWRRNSDVDLVEYGDNRFSGPAVVRTVTDEIVRAQSAEKPYARIVIIGASMGGLVSYDVILQLRAERVATPIDLIVLDAPTSASDFQSPKDVGAPALRFLPFGPLWNQFNLVKWVPHDPEPQNLEPGVNLVELHQRVVQAGKYRASFMRDEMVFIMDHGSLAPGSLNGKVDSLVYVRSTRDTDTVRPEAYNAWASAFSATTKKEVKSPHVGFGEYPKAWKQAFAELLPVP